MKSIFTFLTLLFTLSANAQIPFPPGPGDNNLPLPPSTDFCRIGCFSGCPPTSPSCQAKRLNIIEEAIQEIEFNEDYSEIKLPFDNSIVNITESKSKDLNTTHIVFKSKLSKETISAVISMTKPNGKNQTSSSITTISLPKGQIVMDNETMKLITANEVIEISLTEDSSKNDIYEMERFQKVFNELVNESDYLEFNLILSELESSNKIGGCFGARVAVAAAVGVLSLATAAAVATGGGLTAGVIMASGELAAAVANMAIECHAL